MTEVRSRIVEGIATIELNRPSCGNALSASLVEQCLTALDAALTDQTVHTVVICANGKHFCTGFDLSNLDSASDGELFFRFVRIELLLSRIWNAPVRTVALTHGRTWGAGADLFAACDFRLSASNTTFRFPGAQFGIVLGTSRLSQRIGRTRAFDWISSGAEIDALTAQSAGLVTDIVQSEMDGFADMQPLSLGNHDFAVGGPRVDRATLTAVRRSAGSDQADSELAMLVRSASQPGLQSRMIAYRDRIRKKADGKVARDAL